MESLNNLAWNGFKWLILLDVQVFNVLFADVFGVDYDVLEADGDFARIAELGM